MTTELCKTIRPTPSLDLGSCILKWSTHRAQASCHVGLSAVWFVLGSHAIILPAPISTAAHKRAMGTGYNNTPHNYSGCRLKSLTMGPWTTELARLTVKFGLMTMILETNRTHDFSKGMRPILKVCLWCGRGVRSHPGRRAAQGGRQTKQKVRLCASHVIAHPTLHSPAPSDA